MKLCGCFYSPTTLQSGPRVCFGNSVSTFKSPSIGVPRVYSSMHSVYASLLHWLQNGISFHMAESEQLKRSLVLFDPLLHFKAQCICVQHNRGNGVGLSDESLQTGSGDSLRFFLTIDNSQAFDMLLFILSTYICRKSTSPFLNFLRTELLTRYFSGQIIMN